MNMSTPMMTAMMKNKGDTAMNFNVKTWNIKALAGYEPITTFYEDFSIADRFGVKAIRDTYKRGLKSAEFFGYEYLTEFVMALNWKIFEHYNRNDTYAELYAELHEAASEHAANTLEGEELEYYYRTID